MVSSILAPATMGNIDTGVGIYKLFGAGSQVVWDAIERQLDAGRDLTTIGGVELDRAVIIDGGARTIASSTMTDIAGAVTAPITYLGRPIKITVDLPQLTHSAGSVQSGVRIIDGDDGVVASKLFDMPTTIGDAISARVEAVLPISGRYDWDIGEEKTFRVQWSTGSGTMTLDTHWQNPFLGSCPLVLRVVQE